jgi:hypothetical protein
MTLSFQLLADLQISQGRNQFPPASASGLISDLV